MDEAMGAEKKENCYEIYYIKEDALKLLLAGLGQTQWYGLFSGDGQKETTNRILAELYQNGMIDWDGAGAALRAPYAKMFSVMLEKKSCVTIQSPVLLSPVRCCYLSQTGVVLTQKSQREDRTLGIALLPVQGFIRMLEAECARLEAGECCIFSCRSSQTGQAFQKLRVSRDGLRAYQVEIQTENGAGTRLHCMQDELAARLGKLLYTEAAAKHSGFLQEK
ncbi:MAG: hypothetical protein K2N87_13575 [Eubacterium sp.]|nr:hypothetical protein [Eubacterium sp.]